MVTYSSNNLTERHFYVQHPHVATVVRFVMETDLSISMLMDCLSDDTLLALMTRSEHLESRFSYYEQIADGMAYLHDRHFIHGCLQAKFIYVTPNGRVSSKLYHCLHTLLGQRNMNRCWFFFNAERSNMIMFSLWSRFAVLFIIFRVTNTEC